MKTSHLHQNTISLWYLIRWRDLVPRPSDSESSDPPPDSQNTIDLPTTSDVDENSPNRPPFKPTQWSSRLIRPPIWTVDYVCPIITDSSLTSNYVSFDCLSSAHRVCVSQISIDLEHSCYLMPFNILIGVKLRQLILMPLLIIIHGTKYLVLLTGHLLAVNVFTKSNTTLMTPIER